MTELEPHLIPIFGMSDWPLAAAEAEVARYVAAGDEAIAWLETLIGTRLRGDEGLRTAWRWTVEAGLKGDLVEEARVRFALSHLFGRAVLEAVPGSSWVCWQPGRKIIGHHAPAITRGRFNEIPGSVLANTIPHIYDARTQELEPWRRGALEDDHLVKQRDGCVLAADAAGQGPLTRID